MEHGPARSIHEFAFNTQENLVSATKATGAGALEGHMSRESNIANIVVRDFPSDDRRQTIAVTTFDAVQWIRADERI
jgi:hypothetical protein